MKRVTRPKRKPNPKDLFGIKKVPSYSVVPSTGMIYEALGMWDGADKYGAFNWRAHPVQAMVYVDAIDRHVKAWVAGQEIDPKSGKPHLGHAKACLGILIDAFETGNMIDNRPKNVATLRLLEQYDRTTPPQEVISVPNPSRSTDRRRAAAPARGRPRAANRKTAR
ncbi:MAG: dATP/dGTP diphosphohydrolase domain-containing protein [Vicinamibacterales bacterium]